MDTPLGSFLSNWFDDELVDALVYLYIYFFCFLAIMYILEHTKFLHAKVYDFPTLRKEPLPTEAKSSE